MPRIKKIKFEDTGELTIAFPSTGCITLDLYYDSKDSYFYFDRKDILKNIKHIKYDDIKLIGFSGCKTEHEAVQIISNLIYENLFVDAKKFLGIRLNANNLKFESTANEFNRGSNLASLTVGYYKLLQVTNSRTGERILIKCTDDWEIPKGWFYDKSSRINHFEWTEHREEVLRNAVETVRDLKSNVTRIFEEAIKDDKLEKILDDVKSDNLLKLY
jgi:hypothetical protein